MVNALISRNSLHKFLVTNVTLFKDYGHFDIKSFLVHLYRNDLYRNDVYWNNFESKCLDTTAYGRYLKRLKTQPSGAGRDAVPKESQFSKSQIFSTVLKRGQTKRRNLYVWIYETRLKDGYHVPSVQRGRYKNYKESQSFFPSFTLLSYFHCRPVFIFRQFTWLGSGLKVWWTRGEIDITH